MSANQHVLDHYLELIRRENVRAVRDENLVWALTAAWHRYAEINRPGG